MFTDDKTHRLLLNDHMNGSEFSRQGVSSRVLTVLPNSWFHTEKSQGAPAAYCISFFIFNLFLLILERWEGEGERERERHQHERETLIRCLPYAPGWGIERETWVCALTGLEPATCWCTGQCSTSWATSARPQHHIFKIQSHCCVYI